MAADTPVVAYRSDWKRGRITSWLTTVDHKRIGILYLCTALVFFALGGILALMIRYQLAVPNKHFLVRDAYNQAVTIHGTTMIFLVIVPILGGFGNYLVPLMIGAQDMAFPRLNALSYWFYLLGGLILYASFEAKGGAAAGRLDVVRDALDAALTRSRAGPLDPLAPRADALVARRGDQLHRDDHEHARTRDDLDADAALRLDDPHLRVAARARAARRSRPGSR